MEIRDLLPIGSVVLLKDSVKRVMIFGVKQQDQENPSNEYDYAGVPYPEGNIGSNLQLLFNHSDIGMVAFRGYEDEERTLFLKNLDEYYKAQAEGRAPVRQTLE